MLPKKNRLTKSFFKEHHHRLSFNKGVFFSVSLFRSNNDLSRAAVIVTKKVAKTAVERNRARRRVYVLLNELLTSLPRGVMITVRVDAPLHHVSFQILRDELRVLVKI